MITVVVDASGLAWGRGGIERYTRAVCRELLDAPQLRLVLVTNSRRPVLDLPGAHEVARRVKGGALWRATVLAGEARRWHADVLWCPRPTVPLAPLPCPLVTTVHDVSPVLHRGTKPWRETLAMATAGRWAVRRADGVLAVSSQTADDLERTWSVPRDRVTVVPLAVDGSFVPADRAAAQQAVQRRWGLEPPFGLAVGTIEPRKGYDLLVDVAQQLPELPLVIAGRVGPRSKALADQLGPTCTLLGGVTDEELLALYRAAEVLLAPSLYEGFGLTPLEALACGTPAVVAAAQVLSARPTQAPRSCRATPLRGSRRSGRRSGSVRAGSLSGRVRLVPVPGVMSRTRRQRSCWT